MEKETVKTSKRREVTGIVTSNKMDKAVKVEVASSERHPQYSKIVKRKKVFFAHTNEELQIGDKVTIRESRPISKKIKWTVINKK
ncbi:30S ribosomal protein S17 [Candidatus Microgenomates bacterium]|jgi:small subunit ribosomal protein S17|nr:30S ribosomal protein S17 [Candidatus Microgenomates bacterium]